MESLRWILLFVGIAVIAAMYFFGRKLRHKKRQDDDVFDDDLPEFNAKNWDDFDEGVGPVRVISGDDSVSADSTEADNTKQQTASDIVLLYILPKLDAVFQGSQLNSSVQAMGLKFGDMNIYHYSKSIDEEAELSGESPSRMIFSLANMHEPGFFDPETIHDITSSGLTVFMQINTSAGVDALDDLTEMLQRSYQIAGLLDGRLCNHKQQPLTEQDAERYREQVRTLMAGASPAETLVES